MKGTAAVLAPQRSSDRCARLCHHESQRARLFFLHNFSCWMLEKPSHILSVQRSSVFYQDNKQINKYAWEDLQFLHIWEGCGISSFCHTIWPPGGAYCQVSGENTQGRMQWSHDHTSKCPLLWWVIYCTGSDVDPAVQVKIAAAKSPFAPYALTLAHALPAPWCILIIIIIIIIIKRPWICWQLHSAGLH